MFYFPRMRVFNPFRDLTLLGLVLMLALVLWLLLALSGYGWAQAISTDLSATGQVNPGNVISLAPLVSIILQAFGVLIAGIVTFYTPVICKAIAKALHVSIDQAMINQATSAASTAAAGIVANAADTAAVKNISFTVNSPEIAAAANAALSKIPAAQAQLGLTPDHMKEIVLGELGKLQASGTPATATPATAK